MRRMSWISTTLPLWAHTVIGLAGGIGSILTTWLMLFCASCGIGLVFRKLFLGDNLDGEAILMSFWSGLFFTIVFLQLWHLFFCIQWLTIVVFLASGAFGIYLYRASLNAWAKRWRITPQWGLASTLVLVSVWIANRSMGPCTAYDSGMYHIPMIRWVQAYPIVPGLGNLHGRLAFNNTILLYAAMVDASPWFARSNHVVNGFFLLVFLAQIVMRFFWLFRASRGDFTRCAFDIALLAPIVMMVQRPDYVSSYTIEVAVAVIIFVSLSLLCGQPAGVAGDNDTAQEDYNFVVAIALLALAASVKLSVCVISILVTVSAVVRLFIGRRRTTVGSALRPTVIAMLLCLTIGVPYAVRGIVLSGYPLYPSSILAVPVEWRVPVEQVKAEAAWISIYARYSIGKHGDRRFVMSDIDLMSWSWLPGWINDLLHYDEARLMIILPLIVALIALVFRWRPGAERGSPMVASLWWILCPLMIATVFWFVAAPRPVFAFAVLWGIAAVCSAGTASATAGLVTENPVVKQNRFIPSETRDLDKLARYGFAKTFGSYNSCRRTAKSLVLFGLILGVLPLVDLLRPAFFGKKKNAFVAVLQQLFIMPGSDLWFHPIGSKPIISFVTDSGLRLFVPKVRNRCFYAPLPCTPHPAPNIRLRGRNLESGFTTDGRWLPQHWPNPTTNFLFVWRDFESRRQEHRKKTDPAR